MTDASAGVDWAAAYGYLEEQYELTVRRLAERLEALEGRLGELASGVIREVTLDVAPGGHLTSVVVADGTDLRYSFYLYRDEQLVATEPYGVSNTLRRRVRGSGAYKVRGFVRAGDVGEHTDSAVSPVVRAGGRSAR